MKKVMLCVFALGMFFDLCCGFTVPLDDWRWRNPLPTGNPPLGRQVLNGVVFADGKFVAVGASGVVSISLDATNWTQSATATTNRLNGLAYANGQFVAVGDGGAVETSVDGTNWALQSSGTSSVFSTIAYGNGKFVAGGLDAVMVSSNGVVWIPAAGISGAVSLTAGSNGFLAVGNGQPVYFSPDGLAWNAEFFAAPDNSPGTSALINGVVGYANGRYLIAAFQYVGEGNVDRFMFSSPDGSNWVTNRLGVQYFAGYGLNYDFFMTAGNYAVFAGVLSTYPFLQFSADGLQWTLTNSIPTSSAPDNVGAEAGAYGNGTYVIVFENLLSGPATYSSTDGLNWTSTGYVPPAPTGPNYALTCIATNNGVDIATSGSFIAISSNGLCYAVASNTPALCSVLAVSNQFVGVGSNGVIYVSSNGLAWTQRNSGTASNLRGLTVGNGLLVAVGDGGAIQTSPSALVWSSRISGTSLPLYGVTYSNGCFVAVGQQGTVLTSPDGMNWAPQYSGVLSSLLSVAYGSAGFVAVGAGGTVVSSPDGTNWTGQSAGTLGRFEGVSFGNGYYLAVGDNALARTSPDGVNWTARNLGAAAGQNFFGSAFVNNHFDVVGSGGTILESDPIDPLFELQLARGGGQNGFTLFATLGTDFQLQGCTSLSLSNWTAVTTFYNASGITRWTNSETAYNQRFFRLVTVPRF